VKIKYRTTKHSLVSHHLYRMCIERYYIGKLTEEKPCVNVIRINFNYLVQCDFKVYLYIYVPLHVSVSK
jgi:hypothetical protein